MESVTRNGLLIASKQTDGYQGQEHGQADD